MKGNVAKSLPAIELPDVEEMPEGWALTTLGEIGKWRTGGTPSRKINSYFNGDIAWVKSGDLKDGIITATEEKITELGLQNCAAKLLPVGTVSVALYGATIGKIGILGIEATTNQACANCIVDPKKISKEFLFYYIFSQRQNLIEAGQGGAQPNLTNQIIHDWPIYLPPLTEQQRIVARIEALLTHINAARDRLSRVPLIMKRFRQAVLATACSGRLTEGWREKNSTESVELALQKIHVKASKTGREATDNIIPGDCILSVGDPGTPYPDGWLRVPLQQIARLESGHTPSRQHPEYWDGNVSWIGIHDAKIHHGGYISKTLQHVTPKGLENSAARLLPLNTVCLSRTASVGYVVIMNSSMATSQDFVNWVCSEALLPKFLMYALMAEGEGIRKFGRGTTHTTIYYPEVKALHICLPPIAEQHEIIRRIGLLFELADAFDQEVAAASRRCERLTQAVLGKAFRGELVGKS